MHPGVVEPGAAHRGQQCHQWRRSRSRSRQGRPRPCRAMGIPGGWTDHGAQMLLVQGRQAGEARQHAGCTLHSHRIARDEAFRRVLVTTLDDVIHATAVGARPFLDLVARFQLMASVPAPMEPGLVRARGRRSIYIHLFSTGPFPRVSRFRGSRFGSASTTTAHLGSSLRPTARTLRKRIIRCRSSSTQTTARVRESSCTDRVCQALSSLVYFWTVSQRGYRLYGNPTCDMPCAVHVRAYVVLIGGWFAVSACDPMLVVADLGSPSPGRG